MVLGKSIYLLQPHLALIGYLLNKMLCDVCNEHIFFYFRGEGVNVRVFVNEQCCRYAMCAITCVHCLFRG